MGDATHAHVLRVRWLHLILLERLHLDDVLGGISCVLVIAGGLVGDYDCKNWDGGDMRDSTYHGEHGDQRRCRARTSSQRESGDGLSCLQRTWWSGLGAGRSESGAKYIELQRIPRPGHSIKLVLYQRAATPARLYRPDRQLTTGSAAHRMIPLFCAQVRANCSHHSLTAPGADDRSSGSNLFRHYSPGLSMSSPPSISIGLEAKAGAFVLDLSEGIVTC